jgi:RNA polymerase sigma-B factor
MTVNDNDILERDRAKALFAEYHRTGDLELRDRLVESNLGLAHHLARKFNNRGEPLEDLAQVAALALIKAVERFDPERGLEFGTFAVPTIVGELKRHFRDKGWAVRVPRRVKEVHLRLAPAVAELTSNFGRSPTIPELAEHLDTDTETIIEAMDAGRAYRASSLDTPVSSSDQGTSETLSSIMGALDPNLDKVDQRSQIASLLRDLSEQERLILHLRFYDGLPQSQIAEQVGLSQMQISRLLARLLHRLRAEILAQDDPDDI